MSSLLKINFDKGTLILQNVPGALQTQLSDIRWNERTLTFRALVVRWRETAQDELHAFLTGG